MSEFTSTDEALEYLRIMAATPGLMAPLNWARFAAMNTRGTEAAAKVQAAVRLVKAHGGFDQPSVPRHGTHLCISDGE